MIGLAIRWLILTLAILSAAYLLEGIHVQGFWTAVFAASALGILNAVLRPILILLTLPLNLVTLGLFTFLINAFILKLASDIIPGFEIDSFWTALFGSLIISIVNWLLSSFISDRGRVEYIDMKKRGGRWE
jgi:putative membrane protein